MNFIYFNRQIFNAKTSHFGPLFSEVEIERVFSSLKLTKGPLRNRLWDETLRNLLVIKESLQRKREAFDNLDCEDIKRVRTILQDIEIKNRNQNNEPNFLNSIGLFENRSKLFNKNSWAEREKFSASLSYFHILMRLNDYFPSLKSIILFQCRTSLFKKN